MRLGSSMSDHPGATVLIGRREDGRIIMSIIPKPGSPDIYFLPLGTEEAALIGTSLLDLAAEDELAAEAVMQ